VPIHDQGYRRYQGHRTPPGQAWWTIARMHLVSAVKRRWFLVMLLAGWIQFVFRAGVIIVSATIAPIPGLATTPQTFRDFLVGQSFFVFILAIAMSGLIADDRRANALQLYLSKPLTRVEYVIGKAVPLLVLTLGVTLVPAFLLLILQITFAGSTSFLTQNLFLLPAITLASLVRSLVASFVILALSSLSKSRRFVAVMYAGLLFFTASMSQVLRGITGSRAWAAISPGSMLDVFTDAVFRMRAQPPVPVYAAVLVIVGLLALCVWILERRVRPVEIVA
jgi:ABC-2 type transport system permease protein